MEHHSTIPATEYLPLKHRWSRPGSPAGYPINMTPYQNLEPEKRSEGLLALDQYFEAVLAIFLRLEQRSSIDDPPEPPYAGDKGRFILENST